MTNEDSVFGFQARWWLVEVFEVDRSSSGHRGSRLSVCILMGLVLLRGCRANVDCFVPAGK